MKTHYETTDMGYKTFASMRGDLFESHKTGRHDGHGHDHGNDADHVQDPAGRFLQMFTVGGNVAVAAAEGATTMVKNGADTVVGTWSVLGDFLHNVGDSASYFMQFNTARKSRSLPAEAVRRRRRVSHSIIMFSSLYTAVYAGYEMFDGEKETAHNPAAVYAAAASVAVSGAAFAGMRAWEGQQRNADVAAGGTVCSSRKAAEHDISKHLLRVDIPSALLALGGSWMQRHGVDADIATYNIPADQVAAVVSGALGAYWFRPTKKNLDHDCTSTGL